VEFAVPQTPELYGLVFNEILFHASEDCSEFIEIYNRSAKPFDFKDLKMGICDLTNFQITREVSFGKSPYLLMPGKFLVITKDARKLPHDLLNTHPELILENSDFFALPDVEGLVVLTNMAGAIIDEFHYNRDYHASMLGNDMNISLEKTDPDMPSGISSSWCSASSLSGYSTPGFRNSQIITDSRSIDVSLSTDMITPDDDGIDDILEIRIKASDPGCMGTLSIFNMWGELVNSLLKNSFLGTDMRLTWDAKDMNDHILNIGPYIIYVEIIKPSGKIEKIKKVVSVIRRNN
jgi:hypothetical protein